MIVRIVKMTFESNDTSSFLEELNKRKQKIREFEGCEKLELLQCKDKPNVIFSYSYWKDESYLEAYRKSDFFRETWTLTKSRFSENPQAWTNELLDAL